MGSRLESNSNAVRKRIENHEFHDEDGEEYEQSKFGGFTDYFRRKKIKLQNLDAERRRNNADKPQIFRGVVAHVNGYTQPSLNDLHAVIVEHGGGFLQYLDGKTMVTHIIASSLTPKKRIEFKRYRIVKPAWVMDSIKVGRLLPWDAYRVVHEGVKQNVLGFQAGNLTSQSNSQRVGYKEQSDTSWYTGQVKDVASKLDGKHTLPDEDAKLLEQWPESDIEISQGSPKLSAGFSKFLPANNTKSLVFTEDIEDGRHHKSETMLETEVTGGFKVPQALADESFDAIHKQSDQRSWPIRSEQDLIIDEEDRQLADGDEASNRKSYEKTTLEPRLADKDSLTYTTETRTGMTRQSATSKQPLTAEDHNAILLADPKMWKSTVVNPGFLKQYYEESRLHHLSTWKADLKSQLQALAQEVSSSQKAKQKRPAGARRYILHVDFDSFFAAVSLKRHPEWIDKPAVVAHGGGSGSEIASCNYPARKFGIKNGMWMKRAQELCSDIKVLPYDFKAYETASRDFYSVILATGGVIQSVSVDEALVDMSLACIEAGGHQGRGISEGSIWREQAKADEIAEQIRADVHRKTGCNVSVGIGGNILLAKLALRKAKPAGQYQIKPDEVLDFIGTLLIQDLPGVAYSIGGKLEEIGVKYIKDARELTKEKLINTLGPKTGEKIFEYARGIDRVEVGDQAVRKSVSAEVNWGIRFITQEQANDFVKALCEELHKRLLNECVKGRQITMKIMKRAQDAPLDPPKFLGHGKCDVFNKSTVLGVTTNDKDILAREALSILKGLNFSPGELRGIGVQMTKLEPMKPSGIVESSQRRLQFILPEHKPSAPIIHGDDVLETPKKSTRFVKHLTTSLDSPDEKSSTLLNISGTQFMLPSQVDPSVLAELPEEIRSKLTSHQPSTPKKQVRQSGLNFKSRTASPAPGDVGDMPPESQLDPDTLAALPDDIRKEVLASYRHPASPSKPIPLPSSPRKALPRKTSTPTKKNKSLLSRMRGPKPDPNSTLTQSNFLSRPAGLASEVDEEFLAALPPDIREEVLAQQREARQQKRGAFGLAVPAKPRRNQVNVAAPQERRVRLPERPPKPTFTSRKLSSLPELRDAIDQWVEAMEGEEPDEADVEALREYLARVVQQEKDMDKAVSVVKWVGWVVGEMDEIRREKWEIHVKRLQDGVQQAVRRRGLGMVEF
jgi:DNA repair protein REV1